MIRDKRLTSFGPPDYAELACDVDDAASLRSSLFVVAGQRLLLQHDLQLGAGGEPATAVVDVVDLVEVCGRHLGGALVSAQDAGRVDAVVDAAVLAGGLVDEVVDELLVGDVAGFCVHVGQRVFPLDLLDRVVERIMVQVCDGQFCATGFHKGESSRVSDACPVISVDDPVPRYGERLPVPPAPVMTATPGKSVTWAIVHFRPKVTSSQGSGTTKKESP